MQTVTVTLQQAYSSNPVGPFSISGGTQSGTYYLLEDNVSKEDLLTGKTYNTVADDVTRIIVNQDNGTCANSIEVYLSGSTNNPTIAIGYTDGNESCDNINGVSPSNILQGGSFVGGLTLCESTGFVLSQYDADRFSGTTVGTSVWMSDGISVIYAEQSGNTITFNGSCSFCVAPNTPTPTPTPTALPTYTFQIYCTQDSINSPTSGAPTNVVFSATELGFIPVQGVDYITISGSPNVDFVYEFSGVTGEAESAHTFLARLTTGDFTCDGPLV